MAHPIFLRSTEVQCAIFLAPFTELSNSFLCLYYHCFKNHVTQNFSMELYVCLFVCFMFAWVEMFDKISPHRLTWNSLCNIGCLDLNKILLPLSLLPWDYYRYVSPPSVMYYGFTEVALIPHFLIYLSC